MMSYSIYPVPWRGHQTARKGWAQTSFSGRTELPPPVLELRAISTWERSLGLALLFLSQLMPKEDQGISGQGDARTGTPVLLCPGRSSLLGC